MNPPAAIQPEATLRPAPGRDEPLPEWAWTTDRNALPDVLEWNSEAERPPIGCRVDVVNPEMGTGTVEYYTHARGILRIVVLLDSVPAWLGYPEGQRHVNLFGDQLIRLDQGEGEVAELPSVTPAPEPATVRGPLHLLVLDSSAQPSAAQPEAVEAASSTSVGAAAFDDDEAPEPEPDDADDYPTYDERGPDDDYPADGDEEFTSQT